MLGPITPFITADGAHLVVTAMKRSLRTVDSNSSNGDRSTTVVRSRRSVKQTNIHVHSKEHISYMYD